MTLRHEVGDDGRAVCARSAVPRQAGEVRDMTSYRYEEQRAFASPPVLFFLHFVLVFALSFTLIIGVFFAVFVCFGYISIFFSGRVGGGSCSGCGGSGHECGLCGGRFRLWLVIVIIVIIEFDGAGAAAGRCASTPVVPTPEEGAQEHWPERLQHKTGYLLYLLFDNLEHKPTYYRLILCLRYLGIVLINLLGKIVFVV